jgi:mycofactocin precursor
MASTDTDAAPSATQGEAPTADESPMEAVSKELLIEEVSIDGMCGVY